MVPGALDVLECVLEDLLDLVRPRVRLRLTSEEVPQVPNC